jgi:hypothetical protein
MKYYDDEVLEVARFPAEVGIPDIRRPVGQSYAFGAD